MDKSGNGYAVRFLPAPQGEDLPWVKLYKHAFQGPGGWYIENSDHSGSEGSRLRIQHHTLEQRD